MTSNIICTRCGGGGHIASDCKADLCVRGRVGGRGGRERVGGRKGKRGEGEEEGRREEGRGGKGKVQRDIANKRGY